MVCRPGGPLGAQGPTLYDWDLLLDYLLLQLLKKWVWSFAGPSFLSPSYNHTTVISFKWCSEQQWIDLRIQFLEF